MTFLVLSRNMFLFPENVILFFARTIKDDLSQKNIWKYVIFCKCSAKMVFQKVARAYVLSCIIKKDDISFSQKSEGDLLPRNTLTMTFLVTLKKTIFVLEYHIGRTSVINVNNISNKFVMINFPLIILKNLRSTISIFTLCLFTEEIDTTAASQLIYNFCLHHKLKMFCKSNNSKWCYVKNCHLF